MLYDFTGLFPVYIVITNTRYDSQNLTYVEASGELRADEIIATIERFYDEGYTEKVLWNLSGASLANITPDEVRLVSQAIGRNTKQEYNIRTALVFTSDAGFGLGRMFETFSDIEKVPNVFKSFRNLADAAQWLGVEIPGL